MAGVTENYGFATEVAVDDFVQPSHNNRLADTVDRVLGSLLRRLMTAGAHEGWSILGDKTVGSGQGLVGACWCQTTSAQAISDLTDDAVNHVFVEATADGGPDGTVSFFAQLSANGPADSVYLGTIELDGGGDVVAIDNQAEGVERQCYPLAWVSLVGSGIIEDVDPSAEETVYVEHDVLRVPGAIELTSESPDFTWTIEESWRGDRFLLRVTNNGGSAADFEYEWAREGVAE